MGWPPHAAVEVLDCIHPRFIVRVIDHWQHAVSSGGLRTCGQVGRRLNRYVACNWRLTGMRCASLYVDIQGHWEDLGQVWTTETALIIQHFLGR